MTDVDLAIHFFFQLACILIACRIVGWLAKRFLGQSQVVGEMIAGLLIGPSLLGAVAPGLEKWLFPTTLMVSGVEIRHPSMQILYVVSQLGLILYMFCVGLEFNTGVLRRKGSTALFVSTSGILMPLIFGALVSLTMSSSSVYFPEDVGRFAAALYLGAAMCITAFPLLARLLYDRGIAHTHIGTLSLAAAAFDDGIAWCMLAIVVATTQNSPDIAYVALGGAFAFIAVMVTVGRRWMRRLETWTQSSGGVTQPIIGVTMMLLLIGAWFTDFIKIYAVFGAFVMGVCMPRGQLSDSLKKKIDDLAAVLLLPIFFTFSGLNTQISLLNSTELWLMTLVLCAIAIFAKGGGCMIAAKLSGETWRNSLAIGTLMNARGLTGLIILNIGLQQGIITPTLFTMMALMAILTTVMASPIFDRVTRGMNLEATS